MFSLNRTEGSSKAHRPSTPVEVKKNSPSKSKGESKSTTDSKADSKVPKSVSPLESPAITPLPSDADKGRLFFYLFPIIFLFYVVISTLNISYNLFFVCPLYIFNIGSKPS